MIEVVLWIGGVAAIFWLAHWYIEVYTPRKHMREAIRETGAMMGRRPPRRAHVPPRPMPAPAAAAPYAPPLPTPERRDFIPDGPKSDDD